MGLENLLGFGKKSSHNGSGLEGKLGGNGNHGNHRQSFGSAIKKFSLWDWTKIVGVSAAGAVFSGGLLGYGALNVLATTASFVTANYLVNRKQGFTKNSVQTEFVLGGVYTPMVYKLLDVINVFTPNPLMWMGAYAVAMFPFTAATHAAKYMIEKYSPYTFFKGIFKGEPLKDIAHIAKDTVTDSITSAFKSVLWLTLPVAGSHYLLPDQYLITSLFPIRTAYRYILESQQQKKLAMGTPNYSGMNPIMQAA